MAKVQTFLPSTCLAVTVAEHSLELAVTVELPAAVLALLASQERDLAAVEAE